MRPNYTIMKPMRFYWTLKTKVFPFQILFYFILLEDDMDGLVNFPMNMFIENILLIDIRVIS